MRLTDDQIKARIKEIKNDSVFKLKTADLFSNSPRAIIQIGMETELHTLEKVLGLPLTDVKKLRKES